jgi:hypothetical protein
LERMANSFVVSEREIFVGQSILNRATLAARENPDKECLLAFPRCTTGQTRLASQPADIMVKSEKEDNAAFPRNP